MTFSRTPAAQQLADLIARALDIADSLDLDRVGIDLNSALERVGGRGVPPRA